MKYIKLIKEYNSSRQWVEISEEEFHKSYETIESFSKYDLEVFSQMHLDADRIVLNGIELNSLIDLKKPDVSLTISKRSSINLFFDKGGENSKRIFILKKEDNYFYVMFHLFLDTEEKFQYRCDEIEGVINLFNDVIKK